MRRYRWRAPVRVEEVARDRDHDGGGLLDVVRDVLHLARGTGRARGRGRGRVKVRVRVWVGVRVRARVCSPPSRARGDRGKGGNPAR